MSTLMEYPTHSCDLNGLSPIFALEVFLILSFVRYFGLGLI